MILTFIPQWGRGDGAWRVQGDVLEINGVPWDFSAIPEGGEAEISPGAGDDHIFIGPVRRIGGTIHTTLIGWVGDDVPQAVNPAGWTLDVADGPVTLPVIREEVAE